MRGAPRAIDAELWRYCTTRNVLKCAPARRSPSDFTRPPKPPEACAGSPSVLRRLSFAGARGGRAGDLAAVQADRTRKISPDERSSPVRQRVDELGRTTVNAKSGHARIEHDDGVARHAEKYGEWDSCFRTPFVPPVAPNLPADPPARTPYPRSTAGETMPVHGKDDEVHAVHDVPKPPPLTLAGFLTNRALSSSIGVEEMSRKGL
ncbi:hypothetical protein EV714DRAFT_278234 [Schizophyllum commune]